MSQHRRITLRRVEDALDKMDESGTLYATEDLFRLLPAIDSFLVKHDKADLARRLRREFDRMEGKL
jgi:hypothetical protein